MENWNEINVREGRLYYGESLVGNSKNKPGFSQYIFDEAPLGTGANGVVYGITHKLLGVRQVIKIYFPKDDETLIKAKAETIKNANNSLAGIVAVVFDAGEYSYPCSLWYSVMESVPCYMSIKEWRKKRDSYFYTNREKFDITKELCRCSIHTSLNLAAGLLKTVIKLHEKGITHGDLNSGNVLWMLEDNSKESVLEKYSSYSYSVLGKLEPYIVRFIDMGSSDVNEFEKAGVLRESLKIYEHMKSLLFPIFVDSENKFEEWVKFEILECEELKEYAVDKVCGVKSEDKILYISPKEMAGDFFRLICVMTIALGIISNRTFDEIYLIKLDNMDNNDFATLMFGTCIKDNIEAISFESMITLQKMEKIGSCGRLINWEKFWKTYPFDKIDISAVFNSKTADDILW